MSFELVRAARGRDKVLMFALWLLGWAIAAYPIYIGAVLGLVIASMIGRTWPAAAWPTQWFVAIGAGVGFAIFLWNTLSLHRKASAVRAMVVNIDARVSQLSDEQVLDEIELLATTSEFLKVTPALEGAVLPAGLPPSLNAFFRRFETVAVLPNPRFNPTLKHYFARENLMKFDTGLWRVASMSETLLIVVHGVTNAVGLCTRPNDPNEAAEIARPSAQGFVSLPRYVLVFALSFEASHAVHGGGHRR